MRTLMAGQLLALDRAASPQFTGDGIQLRLIRVVHEWQSGYDGWIWLDGYEMNSAGEATERRSVYVCAAGIRLSG